jgi:hypothetical protein
MDILNEVYFMVRLTALGGGAWLGYRLVIRAVARSRVNRIASVMHSLGPSYPGTIHGNTSLVYKEDADIAIMRMCAQGPARKVDGKFELTPEGETIIGHGL